MSAAVSEPLGLADSEAISAFVSEAHGPLEALVHQFCDEAYGAIMQSTQDYLMSNVLHNLGEAVRVAKASAQADRERAMDLERRVRKLEAALRVSRGWVITCSESEQARRDLKTIDEALGLQHPATLAAGAARHG